MSRKNCPEMRSSHDSPPPPDLIIRWLVAEAIDESISCLCTLSVLKKNMNDCLRSARMRAGGAGHYSPFVERSIEAGAVKPESRTKSNDQWGIWSQVII